ncbi:unnamed protein product [Orchesella dallaii]|uniref:F-box domain-containing protein n=1 Tax=Orchesella dallaii TaxID=48710 RepID=A0ABP1S7M5_9HEXA
MFSRFLKVKEFVISKLADARQRSATQKELEGDGALVRKERPSFCGLLPEIWDKIFTYLGPQDILVAINTVPEWRELMKDQIASALLPEVLPVLVDNLTLPLKSILIWRGVNRKSKRVIEQLLEEDATSSQKHYENHTNHEWNQKLKARRVNTRLRVIGKIKKCYVFRSGEEIDKFLKHMGSSVASFPQASTPENPILSKSLRLQTGGGQADGIWRFMLLARYGHHVSELTCFKTGNIFGESLVHFVALLNHVPNLKILKLTNSLGLCSDDSIREHRDIEFPELRQLSLLVVELLFENFEPGEEQYSINRLLLKFYGPQLKILMCGENFFSVVDQQTLNSKLRNLKILKLRSVDKNTLVMLSAVNWKLEELQICAFNERDRGPGFLPLPPYCILDKDLVKLEDLASALNNFKDTLTHFQLNVPIGDKAFFLDNTDLIKVSPKVVKLTTALANLGYNWFWPMFDRKLPNLIELTLHTTTVTPRQIQAAEWNFALFRKLERIKICCARPGRGEEAMKIITRNSLRLMAASTD